MTTMRRISGPARIRAVVSVAATLAAACGGGSNGGTSTSPTPAPRPSSPAKIAILSPKNGEAVHGSDVHIRLRLTGGRIVPATTTQITPTTGHVHLFVDNQVVSMNYSLDQTLNGLKPGTHVLRVEFVASDHLPFDPRVFASTVFEVKR
jgi:Family of unknown function (DUF6130)